MTSVELVGLLLASSIFVFGIGAARWKLAYEGADALPLIHADRRRRAWIHLWMIPGVLLSGTGLFGFALLAADAVMFVAASLFAIGVVLMLVHLLFRLTVVPWAAQRRVEDGVAPTVVRTGGEMGREHVRRPHDHLLRLLRCDRRWSLDLRSAPELGRLDRGR